MTETCRLFFALEIPVQIKQQIIHWRAAQFPEQNGRPVSATNLHLTLAFPGNINEQKQRALSQCAGRIVQPGFTFTLNNAGYWPRSGIVCLGSQHVPPGLVQLANILRSRAARNGCYQSPWPWHPYITLFHHALRDVLIPGPGFCWQFPVNEFGLYESVFRRGQTQYLPLKRWILNKEEHARNI